MMIGRLADSGRPRITRQTSAPFTTGRLISRMTRSGAESATARSAVSPLAAMSTSASPDRSSACLIKAAISCSSSTTRTLGTRLIPIESTGGTFHTGDRGVKCALRASLLHAKRDAGAILGARRRLRRAACALPGTPRRGAAILARRERSAGFPPLR